MGGLRRPSRGLLYGLWIIPENIAFNERWNSPR
jgi:hypothetical protein